jgi:hypothetical protein
MTSGRYAVGHPEEKPIKIRIGCTAASTQYGLRLLRKVLSMLVLC